MLCVPIASAAVVKVAVVPEIAAEPRMVAPSLKVTVPLADDPPETVAVKVIDWPADGEVDEAASVSEAGALPTVTVTAVDVAPALPLSPS